MHIKANMSSYKETKREKRKGMQGNAELKTINSPCGGQDFSNTDDVVHGLACKYMRVVMKHCKNSGLA
jgi:hypothetical protein